MKENLFAIVALLLFAVIAITVAVQWADCAKLGGEFVRGVIWFKCIK